LRVRNKKAKPGMVVTPIIKSPRGCVSGCYTFSCRNHLTEGGKGKGSLLKKGRVGQKKVESNSPNDGGEGAKKRG